MSAAVLRNAGAAWGGARTLAELGVLTASWLEGQLSDHPGYTGGGPDPETIETPGVVPALAALNRAGFVTVASQPGCEGIGYDGAVWTQRAAVMLLCSGDRAAILNTILRGTWCEVISNPSRAWWRRAQPGICVTRREGRDYTTFGYQLGRGGLSLCFGDVLSPSAFDAVCRAQQVTVYDRVWGRNSLWRVLEAVTRPRSERTVCVVGTHT